MFSFVISSVPGGWAMALDHGALIAALVFALVSIVRAHAVRS